MISMEFHLLSVLALLCVVVVGSNAILPAEVYWRSKWPNTPIPRDLQNLLQPDMKDNTFGEEKDGNHPDKHYENAFGEEKDGNHPDKHYENAGSHPFFNYGNAFEEDKDGNHPDKRYENAGSRNIPFFPYGNAFDDENARNHPDKRYENAGNHPDKRYENAFEEEKDGNHPDKHYENAFEKYVNDHRKKYKRYEMKSHKLKLPNLIVYFIYDDFHKGQKMKLYITKSFNYARFLPRQIADDIPFSSDKLSEILEHFSIEPESSQGKIIKQTIEDCESSGIKGEDRYCPTSLEALVDFSFKHIGDKAKIIFNEINEQKRPQEYTILDVKFVGENLVICHKQKYPYAVYYCHTLIGTKVYTAPLLGVDGTKANAVAVCHSDTSNWHPKHLAFLLLNIKPGDGPVCHFIRSDTLVIVSANEIKEKSSDHNVLLMSTT